MTFQESITTAFTSNPRELNCTGYELNRVGANGGIVIAERTKRAFYHTLPAACAQRE